MDKLKTKKLWLFLALLLLLSPLGLLAEGAAWAEWGGEELREMLGFVPAGLESTISLWQAPAPDYSLGGGSVPAGVGYVISGLLGVGAVAGVTWLLGRWLGRSRADG